MNRHDDTIRLTPATDADQPMLRRLMQLYFYDFSEFVDVNMNSDGTFENDNFIDEQFGPNHQTFVIRAGGRIAGFAIVSARSYITGDDGITDMAQFFVMRAHRRRRVGERAATALFDMFPGPWEVRVIKQNDRAKKFWRTIIDRYSGSDFTEAPDTSDPIGGIVLRFTAPHA